MLLERGSLKNATTNTYSIRARYTLQKSPIQSEKSPIHSEKSPIQSEKSPIHSEKSPIHSEKSPIYKRQQNAAQAWLSPKYL